MRLLFIGTSPFAVPSLEALIASHHDVVAVVTQPDRPRGRGKQMRASLVKDVALAHSIPLLQPERIGSADSAQRIRGLGAMGAMIVVAYGQKITPELLELPQHGVINVHGSILPKYRGAAPIQHAIIAGETHTGVTTMLMDEGWDTGDILLQESVEIHPNETAGGLEERLALLGARLLVRTCEGVEDGTIAPIPQDDELATLAPSLKPDAGAIDWSRTASDLVNLIRGCTPRPGAFTRLHGVQLKIWGAAVQDWTQNLGKPGQIVAAADDGLVVAAGGGSVRITEVQPESRKRMSAADYARGVKIAPGDLFDARFEMPH
ncbi:MAG: methionyl-tRNA formyltransferase [Armatimonadetes bacterium RBG_16_58_9]|nr:MAG: methionyl-tRNA formyltransferase [Armatimonadetes bacterium RBG_16_58_9]